MKNFFRKRSKKPTEKIFGLRDLEPEILAYRVLPHFLMKLAEKYFRLQIEGAEHIPRRGPALIAPNHSGFSGIDALLLSHEVFKLSGRLPRLLTQLKKNNLVIVFPEGEAGNFKPSNKRYHLQPFKSGFVRMALLRQCPIIPTLILGAEETHFNLANLKFSKFLPGVTLPLPFNILPLPAKWKIKFLPPIFLPYQPDAVDDRELLDELLEELREQFQTAISEEVAQRGSVYFD